MRKTREEEKILSKLASGELDGVVGRELECGGYKKVSVGKYIKDGVPVSYRETEGDKFFNGKENEYLPGKREEVHCDTEEEKLEFMQRYGWLIEDEDAKRYSAKFKEKA